MSGMSLHLRRASVPQHCPRAPRRLCCPVLLRTSRARASEAADKFFDGESFTNFVSANMAERALTEAAEHALAQRLLTNAPETAEEASLLLHLAKLHGAPDAETLIATFSRIHQQPPELVRERLLLTEKLSALGLSEEMLTRFFEEELPSGWVQDIKDMPSVAGFPPNSEVESNFEAKRANFNEVESFCSMRHPALQSPFGPSLSYASVDELLPVTLDQLLNQGQPIPSTRLELTVCAAAYDQLSCIMCLVEDVNGRRVRLALYDGENIKEATVLTASKSELDALAAAAQERLPLGARFVLKNPFLKRSADKWLTLRVDDPASLVRLDLVPLAAGSRLLVLGDGDFSFSAALARINSAQSARSARLTVTSLDSHATAVEKYVGAGANLDALALDTNVTVLHGVDATKLPVSPSFVFDTIVWNFPYPPGIIVVASTAGASLISGFLACARNVLAPGGQIRLLMAKEQGGSSRDYSGTRSNWDIEALAREHRFVVSEVLPFNFSLYPGYKPRREINGESFPYQDARVYILTELAEDAQPDEPNALRHERTKLMQMFLSNLFGRGDNTTPVMIQNEETLLMTRERLESLPRSATVTALLRAMDSFELAMEHLQALEVIGDNTERDARIFVSQLSHTLSIEEGYLVVRYSEEKSLRATAVAMTVLILDLAASVGLDGEEVDALYGHETGDPLDGLIERAVSELVAAPQNHGHNVILLTLANTILVVAHQLSVMKPSFALDLLYAAQAMGFMDVRHFLFRAQLSCFKLNALTDELTELTLQPKGKRKAILDLHKSIIAVIDAVVSDCDWVLGQQPDNCNALYTKASALRYHPLTEERKRCIPLFERYLQVAQPDARQRPSAHFHAGLQQLMGDIADDCQPYSFTGEGAPPQPQPADVERARKHFVDGMAAEERRLPVFAPCNVTSREDLSAMLVWAKSQPPRARSSAPAKQPSAKPAAAPPIAAAMQPSEEPAAAAAAEARLPPKAAVASAEAIAKKAANIARSAAQTEQAELKRAAKRKAAEEREKADAAKAAEAEAVTAAAEAAQAAAAAATQSLTKAAVRERAERAAEAAGCAAAKAGADNAAVLKAQRRASSKVFADAAEQRAAAKARGPESNFVFSYFKDVAAARGSFAKSLRGPAHRSER